MRSIVVPLLAALALPHAVAAPPSPEVFFGHQMGADRSTLEWGKTVEYFQVLERSSDRVRLREFGRSTEGRPMIVAIISAPENLKRLDRFEQIQNKLADPRQTPEAEAEKLAAEGKTIVLITCTIHSTELASTSSAVEFAFRLATLSTPRIQVILKDVILLLAPSINPDGLDLVTRWYRKTLGTPFEGTSPPELYQKYVGHDNNRDWYIFSQAETRAVVSQLQNVWHPQIVYDLHQMGPASARMFVPPWMDPIDPNVDPQLAQTANMVGINMAYDLTSAGRKGIVINAVYDFWTPGRHYQSYHGGIRILTESASVRIATPVTIKPDQISSFAQGYNPRESSWNYLEPWLGGEWRLRDIVEDQLIAMESVCTTAASRRLDLLRGFYQVNRRASERRAPYAFVLPAAQADPGAARKLAETLDFGEVELDRALESFTVGSKEFTPGSYIVRMQQPFSSFAKTLLERQKYPDLRMYPGGPPKRPYDVTAHTLPLLMGVSVETVEDQFQAKTTRAREFKFSQAVNAREDTLAASDSDTWKKVNEAWRSAAPVWRSPQTGDFYIGTGKPNGAAAVARPRVALYKSYMPSMDEGWTRWILEQFGWEYTSLGNAAITAGNLRGKLDVIVFPDQGAGAIQNGYRQGSMPEEFTGGLGKEGAEALRAFVEAGGRLVFLNDSTEYAIEALSLKAKNVLRGVSTRDFYCPGSLLNVKLEPGHPLGLGLPAEFAIWSEQSPAWDIEDPAAKVAVRYAQSPVLASGWLLGEKYLAGKPALADIPLGQGRVLLFGMRPQYRAQSYLTLKLFFNALVY